MKDIQDFFQCCGSSSPEPQLVITMQHKKRTQSCASPAKKTFIKRSIGKNPIIELSPKDTNSSTIHTLKGRQSMKIKRTSAMERNHSLNSSHDASFDFYDHVKVDNSPTLGEGHRKAKQVHQFINFGGHKERYMQERLFANTSEKIFELQQTQQTRIAIPRLLHGQRSKKHPQTTKIRYERPSPSRASPHMATMKTILQTIQQRSSIPSLQQSHLYEMHQIASKATLKSNIYDKNGATPLTQKYESVMFQSNRSKQSFRMANSENLASLNIQNHQQFLNLIVSKLTMDNTLLERQYNALLEEQSLLMHKKQYDLQQFQLQLSSLQSLKAKYLQGLHPCTPAPPAVLQL